MHNQWEMWKITIQITEFQYHHSHYEACVTWHEEMDMLCCNPSFNNAPCYDCVMVKMSTESDVFIFAHLIFIFTFTLADTPYPFALVHPLDGPTGLLKQKGQDLGLIQWLGKSLAPHKIILYPLQVPGNCYHIYMIIYT